jgi:hypothetical protein
MGVAARRWLGALIAAIAAAALLSSVVRDPSANAWMLGFLGYLVVGPLLIWRLPANRIGWLLLATGAAFVGGGLYYDAPWGGSLSPVETALLQPVQVLGWIALATLVTLFPTGRVQSRSQAILLRAIGVVGVIVCATLVTDVGAAGEGRRNPLALPAFEPITSFLVDKGFAVIPLLLLGALVSFALRWRRSVGVERQQFRWLGWAFGICFVGVIILWLSQFSTASLLMAMVTFTAIPVAVGVAVSRYQLFDLDRILSRTAAYAIVTGLLLATYAVVAVTTSAIVGSDSTLAVAAATLTAAALARPLLRRTRSAVDRRFNRSAYDALGAVEAFGGRLRTEVDPGDVRDDLVDVARTTLQPQRVALWLRSEP